MIPSFAKKERDRPKSKRRCLPHRTVFWKCLLIPAYTVLLVKALDVSLRGSGSLLSGIERMALAARFHVDLFLRGTGNECIPAVARHGAFKVLRMDAVFCHSDHLSCFGWFPTIDFFATLRLYHSSSEIATAFFIKNDTAGITARPPSEPASRRPPQPCCRIRSGVTSATS